MVKFQKVLKSLRGPRVYSAPPDGGYGWLVALGSCCAHFLSVGIQLCGGLFLTFWLNDQEYSEGWNRGNLSLIVSLQGFIFLASTIIMARVVESLGVRAAIGIGGAFLVLSHTLTAMSSSPYQLYFTYSFLSGIGSSLPSSSSVILVQRYFQKRRASAAALCVSGTGFAVLVIGPFMSLLPDWRSGFIVLAALVGVLMPIIVVISAPIVIDSSGSATGLEEGGSIEDELAEDEDAPRRMASMSTEWALSTPVPAMSTRLRPNLATPRRTPFTPRAPAPTVPDLDLAPPAIPEIPEELPPAITVVAVEAADSEGTSISDSAHQIIRMKSLSSVNLSIPQMFKIKGFVYFCAYSFVIAFPWYIAFQQLIPAATDYQNFTDIDQTDFVALEKAASERASILLLIQGIANTIGRLVIAQIGERMGLTSIRMFQGSLLGATILMTLLAPLYRNFVYLVIFQIMFSAFAGCLVSIYFPLLVELIGIRSLANAVMVFNIAQSPFSLVGSPISGFLRDSLGSYTSVWVLVAVMFLVGLYLSIQIERSMKREPYNVAAHVDDPEGMRRMLRVLARLDCLKKGAFDIPVPPKSSDLYMEGGPDAESAEIRSVNVQMRPQKKKTYTLSDSHLTTFAVSSVSTSSTSATDTKETKVLPSRSFRSAAIPAPSGAARNISSSSASSHGSGRARNSPIVALRGSPLGGSGKADRRSGDYPGSPLLLGESSSSLQDSYSRGATSLNSIMSRGNSGEDSEALNKGDSRVNEQDWEHI